MLTETEREKAERRLSIEDTDKLKVAWEKRINLWAEGSKLRAEGDKLWAEAIIEIKGNIIVEWKNYSSIIRAIQNAGVKKRGHIAMDCFNITTGPASGFTD